MHKASRYGPIGLDIGTTGLRMIQFSCQGDEPTLAAAAVLDFPVESCDYGVPEAVVRKTIAEALASRRFRGREAVAALACHEMQINSIRLPRMPAAELAGAVAFEAQDRFDSSGGPLQIRFIPAGEVRHGSELREEIIVMACREETVSARVRLLESVRLRPIALDAAPAACARSFARFLRRAEDATAVNVFLDVGWHGTSVVISRGTNVAFLKVIDVGGQHLNRAVARACGISTAEAAALRRRLTFRDRERRSERAAELTPEIQASIANAVRPLLERLSREVQLCLRYYAVTFRGQRPDSVTFVGGEAGDPHLLKIVGEGLDVACTVGHPLRGVRDDVVAEGAGGGLRKQVLPACAVACGLAMRGLKWVRSPDAVLSSNPAAAGAA